jgi:hypothetical protein
MTQTTKEDINVALYLAGATIIVVTTARLANWYFDWLEGKLPK